MANAYRVDWLAIVHDSCCVALLVVVFTIAVNNILRYTAIHFDNGMVEGCIGSES